MAMNKYGTAAHNNVRNATVLDVQTEIKEKEVKAQQEEKEKKEKSKE
jgi:hypothetical protein